MANNVLPKQNLFLGGGAGVEVYASTLKKILLEGQEQLYDHHYIVPFILQGIQSAFQKIIDKHEELFCVRQNIYNPNNVSIRRIIKTFPRCRFAEAVITIRNGENVADQHIHDDINYANLIDQSYHNHETIHVFKRGVDGSSIIK